MARMIEFFRTLWSRRFFWRSSQPTDLVGWNCSRVLILLDQKKYAWTRVPWIESGSSEVLFRSLPRAEEIARSISSMASAVSRFATGGSTSSPSSFKDSLLFSSLPFPSSSPVPFSFSSTSFRILVFRGQDADSREIGTRHYEFLTSNLCARMCARV